MIYRATNAAAMRTAAQVLAHRTLGIARQRRRAPKQRPPLLVEAAYAKRLIALMDVRAAIAPIQHELPIALAAARADGWTRTDASPARRMAELMDTAKRRIDDAVSPLRVERVAQQYARDTLVHQRAQLHAQARAALGIDIHLHDRTVPALVDHFSHENATRIGVAARKVTDEIAGRVASAFTSGQREETIAADIANRLDISDRKARFIARDQIGSLNGRVTAARHTELGIRQFVWSTMNDDNVRPEHEELADQTFDYDDPPSEGYPGTPIACRCQQQPVYSDIISLLEGDGIDGGGYNFSDEE